MLLLIIAFAIAFTGLLRNVLILIGVYKTPILATFEQYGEEYLPLPGVAIVGWVGGLVMLVGIASSNYFGPAYPMMLALGIFLIILALWGYYSYTQVAAFYYRYIPFPRWHHELVERTTRYERRRIAYMWLHLPLRTRLTYNSSDKHFFNWADFVIMGTIREEEKELYDDAFYAGR